MRLYIRKFILCGFLATAVWYIICTKVSDNGSGNLSEDEKVFTLIYKSRLWGVGSGPGSFLRNTKEYRKLLQDYLHDPRFHKVVDYGCGDFQVMKFIQIPDKKVYIGLDVVQHVIDKNNKLYKRENTKFFKVDDFQDADGNCLELLSGDLLIIKDVMIHWPNEKIQAFIDVVLPNFKYALVTNDVFLQKRNQDIELGDFRPVDIKEAPFNTQHLIAVQDWVGPLDGKAKRTYFYTNQRN